MLKRTKGRILLTLLVITGLAGTLNNSSISQKERKQAIVLLKTSKTEFLNSIAGLSDRQFQYRPSATSPSIADLLAEMVAEEKWRTSEIRKIMDRPSDGEDRGKIAVSDEQLLANSREFDMPIAHQPFTKPNATTRPNDAIKQFLGLRAQQIKYIRNSTEDLRNHVVNTPSGWIDCYQFYLLLADRSN
ncbi:MAG: hypothetical protein H7Y42_14690, partial [Chitinophagaceae bacterium]|nr:hypothetical protein [Chitinophagaceae bacterium]